MNEQRRIAIPGKSQAEHEERKSSVERAIGEFDLRSFAPPPVPRELIKPGTREARRKDASTARTLAIPEPQEHFDTVSSEVAAPVSGSRTQVGADDAPAPVKPVAGGPTGFQGKLHAIDRNRLRETGMIEPGGKVTTLLEEFRIVKRRLLAQAMELRRLGAGGSAQRILVTSPHPGEGKTYCAVNLALSIAAEKENEVILVDADFARPCVPDVLGLPDGPGLMDALSDDGADVAQFVLATDIPGLWVLPAGSQTNYDSEYLNSSRTPRILDRLIEGAPHRMVIFDSSPTLAASASAELARYVAQTVMVVRADETGQGALEDAISLLSACPNVQLLLNAAQFSPSGRRFGDYGYRGE